MPNYRFSVVVLAGELSLDDSESLYEAGCDDGTIATSRGVHTITFNRDADSLEAAMHSAVADIKKAGFTPGKIEIESADLQPVA